jgi:hypothetical protein
MNITIPDDHKKGAGDSLYIIATGKQDRYDNASIKRIVLNILMITRVLISFMLLHGRFRLQI